MNRGDGLSTMAAPATTTTYSSETLVQQPEFPEMDLQHVALSLRWTCEMNRRLQDTEGLEPSIHDQDYQGNDRAAATGGTTRDPVVGMQRGGTMVHVHPSQQWQPPIEASSRRRRNDGGCEEEGLTLFHAKTPRKSKKVRRGASRWGPELHLYLRHITAELNVQENSLITALAILYMDRACSVETPRSNGAVACPYVSPRTVHRLILVSMIVATKAVKSHVDTSSLEASLGIPREQLEHMEAWMRQALGDAGLYVMPSQLDDFFRNWQRIWDKQETSSSSLSSSSTRIKKKKDLIRPIQSQHNQSMDEAYQAYGDQSQKTQESSLTSDAALSCW